MNDKQNNKFNALGKIRDFWERVATKITLQGKIVGYIADFGNILGAIAIKSGIHLTGTTTFTSNKEEKKKLYINSLLQMVSGLGLICKDKDDPELTAICKMKYRTLANMRSADFNTMADAIKGKAIKYKTDLLLENLDEADFTDLETDYQGYKKAAAEQSNSESAKIAATTSLVDLFKKADLLIEEFQKVVNILAKKNPDLPGEFEIARTVKNLGTRHNNKPSDEEDTRNEDINEGENEPPANTPPEDPNKPAGT